jgi:hypothetical protein
VYTIPRELVKQWDDVKHKMAGRIDKAQINMPSDERARLKKNLTELLDSFDKGLKTRMKAAATATNDADAKKAAGKVVEIVDEYNGKVDAATAKHQAFGAEARKAITEILIKIRTHAVASTKSAAPVAFPKTAIDGWSTALQTVKDRMSANDANAFGGPFLTSVQTPVRNALNAVDDAGKRGDTNALGASLKALRVQLAKTVTVLNQWATKSPATRNKARDDLINALQSLLEVTNATAAKLRS